MSIFNEFFVGKEVSRTVRVTMPDGSKVKAKLTGEAKLHGLTGEAFAEAAMNGCKAEEKGEDGRLTLDRKNVLSGAAARSLVLKMRDGGEEPAPADVPEKVAKRGRSVIPTASTNGTHSEPAAV